MKYIIMLCLILSGCATAKERDALSILQASAAHRVESFNAFANTEMPVPSIHFGTPEHIEKGNWGTAYHNGVIVFDSKSCLADFDLCINDKLPHELAHEAVYFLFPANESWQIGHSDTWCDLMRKMGGHPENESWEHCLP